MSDRIASIARSAERVLTESLGGPVRLGLPAPLGGERERSTVMRCPVEDGPPDLPRTVIVKMSHSSEVSPQTDQTAAREARQRFLNEMAAAAFLTGLPIAPPIGPRLYGSDPGQEILILEDLGDGVSLADVLRGNDPGAAIDGLNAYARTLGRLHAATIGAEETYAAIRDQPAGTVIHAWAGIGGWTSENLPAFIEACASLDIPMDAAFRQEVQAIDEIVTHPGPFLAFNVSDACPDNHFLAGDTVRLFDFEFGGFGHALLEGSYLRLPFPTCWCVGRLPSDVQARAEEVYRHELALGCAAATDDQIFEPAMLSACAYWTIRSVSWTVERTLREDDLWGLAPLRQRHVYRLETLARQTEEAGFLEGIGRVCAHLARTLRARWQADEIEMPLYPAFAGELSRSN